MKRLIIICLLLITATVYAAGVQYYSYPNAHRVKSTTRILAYDTVSGSRNITGATLRRDVLSDNSDKNTTVYARVMEIRDKSGNIVYYVQDNGRVTIGSPLSLSVSAVYPSNGATNVSNGTWFNYSSTTNAYNYWGRINTTIPVVTFNKYDRPSPTISPTGSSTAVHASDITTFTNFSGAAGTLYTMSFNRTTYTQTDGEIVSSCGVMTDASGLCTSTFRMK